MHPRGRCISVITETRLGRPFFFLPFFNARPEPLVFREPSIRSMQHVPDTRLYITIGPPTPLLARICCVDSLKISTALSTFGELEQSLPRAILRHFPYARAILS